MLAARNLVLSGRLSGVSATLQPGQLTAICGPNGAGKSSLLGALAGLLSPDSGNVVLNDGPLAALPATERARQIGYLPQSGEVAWDVSVEVLVSLGRLPWRGAGGEDAEAIEAAIATLDLGVLRHRPVTRLSGGERARALLARVLAGHPHWLLADEPLANLDLAHQLALLRTLRRLAQEGLGVVVVLHDLAQAMNFADRVLLMQEGRLMGDGAPEEILNEAALARVWGVEARWMGVPGSRALQLPG